MRIILLIIFFLSIPATSFSQNTNSPRKEIEKIFDSALKYERDGKFLSELNLIGSIMKNPKLNNKLHFFDYFAVKIRLAQRAFEFGQTEWANDILDSIFQHKNIPGKEAKIFFSDLEKLGKLASSKKPISVKQV